MPSNIEIKARVHDPARKHALAAALAGMEPATLHQRDTFYPCAQGRLKLRELSPTRAELIAYSRPDQAGTKRSDYTIFHTDDPAALHTALAAALGTKQVVSKVRTLFLVDQTRVHLDEVEGLGSFIELEVVLHPGQSDADGQRVAQELMAKLEITPGDLLEGAYADMLPPLAQAEAPPA